MGGGWGDWPKWTLSTYAHCGVEGDGWWGTFQRQQKSEVRKRDSKK